MTTKKAEVKKTKKPDFYAYATVPNGRGNRIGSRLGVVFNHEKGNGFTLFLDAQPIPVDGQVELVCYQPNPQSVQPNP